LNERPIEDTVFILSTGKLDAAAQKTNWYKTIDQIGAHITVWPIEAKQLPGWLQARARVLNLQFDQSALIFLTQCVEGNLLAAAQWLEKLSIQYPHARITEPMIAALMEDSSRYDVFELISHIMQGNKNKAWHILQKLQIDGEATLIVWALAKELRVLYQLQQQKQRTPLNVLFQQFYIWPKRQPDVEAALRRISAPQCLQALQDLAKVDAMIKGGIAEDPWTALGNVIAFL
jgi:DNA polymerase-3 subunit delta